MPQFNEGRAHEEIRNQCERKNPYDYHLFCNRGLYSVSGHQVTFGPIPIWIPTHKAEIMTDEIQKALLEKGYFPKELPPTFTTKDFGTHSPEILEDWASNGVFTKELKRQRGAYTYKLVAAEAEIVSMPKRGYERRNIHITHPIPQALLVLEMARNLRSIQKWLSRQTYSEDSIRVSHEYERSIKGINFNLHSAKKAYIQSTADWLVTTDISRFYPSIYTHSIAWAAYGKENVKSNLTGC